MIVIAELIVDQHSQGWQDTSEQRWLLSSLTTWVDPLDPHSRVELTPETCPDFHMNAVMTSAFVPHMCIHTNKYKKKTNKNVIISLKI